MNTVMKSENTDGTVGKALSLLDIVERFQGPVRFNDILENSPFPKPSTYRLLQTLVSQEMLSFNADSGHYTLGSRLIRLAHSSWKSASLAPLAAPYLDKLSAKTGETIHLATLDSSQVLYLDKRNANKPINMFSGAGKTGPAYCTGVGKAMLAFLDEKSQNMLLRQQSYYKYTENTYTSNSALKKELDHIHNNGVSFDNEEHEPNIICVAVPILRNGSDVIGAISITSSTLRTSLEKLSNYKNDLIETAKQIGENSSVWMLPKLGG